MTRSASPIAGAVTALDDDSRSWGIPPWLAWLLLVTPPVFMVGMIAIGSLDETVFHDLIDEDHPIEWAQFFAILIASGAFALSALRARAQGRHGLAAIYLVVAVGAFVAAGEEISWGQRVLGFATPSELDTINHQGESNLHNISAIQRLFNFGEMLAGLYGFLLPLLWLVPSVRARVGRWLDALLVPPLCLIALFFLPFAYRAIRLVILQDAGERIVELGEVPELAFYVGALVMGLVTARALRTGSRNDGPVAGSPTTPTA